MRPVADAEIGLDHDRHGCPTTLPCFSRFGLSQYCFPPYHPRPPARLIPVWTACDTSDLQRVTRKNKCCPCRGSKIKPGWFREPSVWCSAELAEPRLQAGNDRSLGLVSRHTAVVRLCTSVRRSRAAVLGKKSFEVIRTPWNKCVPGVWLHCSMDIYLWTLQETRL